ncbi:MAG TPA: hypothetical protein PK513_05430 [Alphaproteobacteria bacterium]|nr:hypothetical protein [Alphaproteobacteria bacterium]USO05832.1 MAG: hypothetical protein H6859_01105 [Rhodospirillales bacterium]HOO81923.1 hypothetical protein [Alphaproteobacteria bacterium]
MSKIPDALAPQFESMVKVAAGATAAAVLAVAVYAAFGNEKPAEQQEPTNMTTHQTEPSR